MGPGRTRLPGNIVIVLGAVGLLVSAADAGYRCSATTPCPGDVRASMLARVEGDCPCAGAASKRDYKNCWKVTLRREGKLLTEEQLPSKCRKELKRALKNSVCGQSGRVLCRRTNEAGTKTGCKVVSASRCAERVGRQTACSGFETCTQVCGAGPACVSVVSTTTLTSSTTTLSPVTTTTTTTLSGTPTARVGPDQEVARGAEVTLDGSASADPTDDPLTYTWFPRDGLDVTGGTGTLDGVAPTFTTPRRSGEPAELDVTTLVFDLVVSDGANTSAPATTTIYVMEDPAQAIFVDGDAGSDQAGDGSRASPYATILHALGAVSPGDPEDLYVKTRAADAAYDHAAELRLAVPDGTSLYGGFGNGWTRDAMGNRTRVVTGPTGLLFHNVVLEAWVSGFEITATVPPGNPQDRNVTVLLAQASPFLTLHVWDNVLIASDLPQVPPSFPRTRGASTFGLSAAFVGALELLDNEIRAGAASPGTAGVAGALGEQGHAGADVSDGIFSGGAGGIINARAGTPGGRGGDGARDAFDNGKNGQNTATGTGGAGGTFPGTRGGSVQPCSVGAGGLFSIGGNAAGESGAGGSGIGSLLRSQGFATYAGDAGEPGGTGEAGFGGPGGGGGFANFGNDGGGGGGGGQGGGGGFGGEGGEAGGVSIGVFLTDVGIGAARFASLWRNVVSSGRGGDGGRGGDAGRGGAGGPGGNGGDGAVGFGGLQGGGGGCGRTGSWGAPGGVGGGGGGGPSYALYLGPNNSFLTLRNNVLTSGDGGTGGKAGVRLGIGQSDRVTAGFGGLSTACSDRDDPVRFVCGLLRDPRFNTLVDGQSGARGEFD